MAADPPADPAGAPDGPGAVSVSVAGGSFRIAPSVSGRDYGAFWARLQSGVWEPECLWLFDRLLKPGVDFYDVGAWIGPTSLFAALKGARVTAFEPDPVARAALTANLALNPQLPVTVRDYALAAVRSRAPLFSHELGNSESSLVPSSGRRGGVTMLEPRATVECRALAEELADIAPTSVVKIDVEGAEFDIFASRRAPPAATYVLSLHGCNVAGADARARLRLRVDKLNALLDAFEGFEWRRLSRWGLLDLDHRAFRAHCARRPPPIDQLVFSPFGAAAGRPRAAVGPLTLWSSDARYQPMRAIGEGLMALRGRRPVSLDRR